MVLREHGGLGADAVAPGFIIACARHALVAGYHVIVEGILHTGSYGPPLRQLIADHAGPSHVYYLDVSFDETIRRHHSRPEPVPVTAEEMRGWYTPQNLLGLDGEHVIPETVTLEHTVTTILETSGLTTRTPLTQCPIQCPRCVAKHAANGGLSPVAVGCSDGLTFEEVR